MGSVLLYPAMRQRRFATFSIVAAVAARLLQCEDATPHRDFGVRDDFIVDGWRNYAGVERDCDFQDLGIGYGDGWEGGERDVHFIWEGAVDRGGAGADCGVFWLSAGATQDDDGAVCDAGAGGGGGGGV